MRNENDGSCVGRNHNNDKNALPAETDRVNITVARLLVIVIKFEKKCTIYDQYTAVWKYYEGRKNDPTLIPLKT